MEGDTIRTSGANMMIDLWLIDRVRPICVTRDAVAALLGNHVADKMNERERCEFVRSKLSLVQKAARLSIDRGAVEGDLILVDGSALLADATMGERRRNDDRRRSDRRKPSRLSGGLVDGDAPVSGERRKGDRRRSDRRGELSAARSRD